MAYFSNASEAEYYTAMYCDRCVHDRDPDRGCPVMGVHLEWNYAAIGENADEAKTMALDILWPRAKDGIHNGQCAMFYPTSCAEIFAEADEREATT